MKRIRSGMTLLATVILCGSLLAGIPAVANASSSADSPVTSSRSFTPGNKVRARLLDESVATTVEKDSKWGGIESLNVPTTKSQAEKDAEANQAAAQQEAAQRQQAAAASRSSSRFSLPTDGIATGSGLDIVNFALKFQGVPYVFGGTDPKSGFDCSGFTQYVFGNFGINLPRTSEAQATVGVAVTDPAPGDLMVAPDTHHVAIYVGNGYMVHAPDTGQLVKVQEVYGTFNYRRLI